MLTGIIVAVASYFLGAIPTAYVAARWLRGIDIRKKGSGQVGGTNAWHSISRKVGVAVIVVDFGKGLAAVLLARVFGLDLLWQISAALAAVAGHNWSVFLRFGGGRGIATMGGALVLLAPREVLVFLGFGLAGLVLRQAPLGMLFGVTSLPVSGLWFREPMAVVFGCLGVAVLMIAKRVMPKRRWPQGDWRRVFMYRILFDRDVRNRRLWVSGTAEGGAPRGGAASSTKRSRS